MRKPRTSPIKSSVKKINLSLSTSDSSFSDNIPFISQMPTQQSHDLLIDADNSDSEIGDSYPIILETKNEPQNSINLNEDKNLEVKNTSPKHSSHKHKRNLNQNQESHETIPQHSNEANNDPSSSQHEIDLTNNTESNNDSQNSPQNIQPSNSNEPKTLNSQQELNSSSNQLTSEISKFQIPLSEVIPYRIERQSKGYGTNFELVMKPDKNRKIIYQTQRKSRKEILICTSPSNPKAYLKHHNSNDSFVLHIIDTNSEICGIYFVPEGKSMRLSHSTKQTKLRIVLPKNLPYFPTDKDHSLASIIANKDKIIPDDFICYQSTSPETVNVLGKEAVNSIKNYVILDHSDLIIFEHFKITDNFFRLHFGGMITPLIAFAICISIFCRKTK